MHGKLKCINTRKENVLNIPSAKPQVPSNTSHTNRSKTKSAYLTPFYKHTKEMTINDIIEQQQKTKELNLLRIILYFIIYSATHPQIRKELRHRQSKIKWSLHLTDTCSQARPYTQRIQRHKQPKNSRLLFPKSRNPPASRKGKKIIVEL